IAAGELLGAAQPSDGDVELLVAPMLRANRELIAGVHRDPQFGPCVMVGIGGVLAEALGDVAFRLVPITPTDAEEMIDDLAMRELLEPFRGEPAVDRGELERILLGLSDAARSEPRIDSIDLNPLLVVDGRPIAVDALVELVD
ncbi:MAG TPA: acetate--CoA ligase family protein, partial [Acidimicrobiia bacterium]